jgi:hypothetical protein
LPLALQDGDVIEHFGIEFPGRFLGGNHDIPHNSSVQPHPMLAGLMRCKICEGGGGKPAIMTVLSHPMVSAR